MPKRTEVTEWLETFEHPLKDTVLRVRQVVLSADRRVDECIKWKSPTFTYGGNIASINPNTKKKVSLMFHRGADIPGKHPRLVGGGGTVKYMYFTSATEVEAQRAALQSVIRAWCQMVDEPKSNIRSPRSASKKKPRAKK